MATLNPFDILGDNDNDDPSALIAAQQQKVVAKKPAPASAAKSQASAKLPSKPLPPAQAVREAREPRSNPAPARGGAGRGGPGRGRGGRGGFAPSRDFGNGNVDGFPGGGAAGAGGGEEGNAGRLQDRERPQRQPYAGGRRGGYGGRGGYGNEEGGGDAERPQRRMYERRSGTGRGYEMKREGSGRGNWGSAADEAITQEKEEALNADDKTVGTEKQADQEDLPPSEAIKDTKEDASNEAEKEEDKEMTLEEYEKIREEKRKALLALKAEERKVEVDKELQNMQQLSAKKEIDPVFVKLGSDKESDKKKQADRDEKSKKAVPITEFLKPAEGERYYNPGRGRGRGRGDRGSFRGGYGNAGSNYAAVAPAIGDSQEFPTLGAK